MCFPANDKISLFSTAEKNLIVNIYYALFVLSFIISTFLYITRKRKLEWVLYVILFHLYSHIGVRWLWIIGSQLTSQASLFLISSTMAYTDLCMLSFMFGIFLLLKLFTPLILNSRLLIFTARTIVWILVLPARGSSFKLQGLFMSAFTGSHEPFVELVREGNYTFPLLWWRAEHRKAIWRGRSCVG